MADLDFGISKESVTNTLTSAGDMFTIGAWLLIIGFVLWFFYYYSTFKHKLRIRQRTSSGYYIRDTWAREFKNKDKVRKWRLWGSGFQVVGLPPDVYLEITKKGRFSAECDRAIDGTITWRRISGSPEGIDSFTTEERTLLIHEYRQSDEYKSKKLIDIALAMAPLIVIVMMFVLLLILGPDFYTKVVQPSIAIGENNLKASDALMESCGQMYEYCMSECGKNPILKSPDDAGFQPPPD